MAQKLCDIAVKTGEYQDRQSGQMKGRWQNVGALMKSDDGSEFIVMHRWFNLAGLPNPNNRDSVVMSCFKPNRQQGNNQSSTYGKDLQQQAPAAPNSAQYNDFEGEPPF